MLAVYFNSPRGRISAHHDPNCKMIQKMQKVGQRTIRINTDNLNSVLGRLENKEFKFALKPELNDLWVFIDLNDNVEEEQLVSTIQHIFGRFYRPLANAVIERHCLHNKNISSSSASDGI